MDNEVFRIYIGSPNGGLISAADNAAMDEIIAAYFKEWIATDGIRGCRPRKNPCTTEQLKIYMVCSEDRQKVVDDDCLAACLSELSTSFPRAFLQAERKDAIIRVQVEVRRGRDSLEL